MIDNTCVIYTNGSQECERVAALLKHLGGEYHEYLLDSHFTQRAFEAEFGTNAEYPQVAIGAKHIGSLKDTLHYCQEQGLLV
jgi:glutaredoxin